MASCDFSFRAWLHLMPGSYVPFVEHVKFLRVLILNALMVQIVILVVNFWSLTKPTRISLWYSSISEFLACYVANRFSSSYLSVGGFLASYGVDPI
ncbi:conserved hypothetical protein [Ricinus communis]|uniref:Uncharacterized protein n=1 Tax=Ricinus communis TaxID=3988 RepID=B9S4W8_RICCO|nr:conserved hypothetical protein [Ricinus communis]